ncbi:VOC family protein [Pseudoalteromonas sp. MTN2-4]|uniref:VOC family protein n=1 Tax=Pseudoalteromonas sp. MTN2-4 TaxID=3056555 RepID=UPI0036F3E424
MQLNHINILTTDVARSVAFYEKLFGARKIFEFHENKVVCIINGFEFFIQKVDEVIYPEHFHLGIRTDHSKLDTLYQVARDLKVPFIKGSNPEPDVFEYDEYRTAFYLTDPDGLEIEVYTPDKFVLDDEQEQAHTCSSLCVNG